MVKQIPPYVKDTTDILRKLDAISSVLDNANLVSLDLKSLYIRIPNAEGIKAVKESCDKKKKMRQQKYWQHFWLLF